MAREFDHLELEALRSRPWQEHERLYAPTGGARLPVSALSRLRETLEEHARACAYPSRSRPVDRSEFDSRAFRTIVDLSISIGEATRREVWAWIAVVLAPHIVKWRWAAVDGSVTAERFAGPIYRNTFGRLWYQSHVLDRGPEHPERWRFAELLGADQLVALLERRSLAACRGLGVAVGEAWEKLSFPADREALFREAMKALVVRAAVQRLDLMSGAELMDVVNTAFLSTAARLSAPR